MVEIADIANSELGFLFRIHESTSFFDSFEVQLPSSLRFYHAYFLSSIITTYALLTMVRLMFHIGRGISALCVISKVD
jgi:hypothetical protein